MVFTLADFGITGSQINAGLTIYGYSVMGADVTTNLANLGGTNYTNATFYPTATSDTSSGNMGGIDLVGVNGIGFTKNPAPEPATYGAWLLGASVGLSSWRNWRRRNRAAPPQTRKRWPTDLKAKADLTDSNTNDEILSG